jgi:hypothetical protein
MSENIHLCPTESLDLKLSGCTCQKVGEITFESLHPIYIWSGSCGRGYKLLIIETSETICWWFPTDWWIPHVKAPIRDGVTGGAAFVTLAAVYVKNDPFGSRVKWIKMTCWNSRIYSDLKLNTRVWIILIEGEILTFCPDACVHALTTLLAEYLKLGLYGQNFGRASKYSSYKLHKVGIILL